MHMSKMFKGKTCVYCGVRMATTADHIFARNFFVIDERQDLPKAPACHTCNNRKSQLEQYLQSVMPLGANHPNALRNLPMATKRLVKNRRLLRDINQDKRRLWRCTHGIYAPEWVIRFDDEKLRLLFDYIVRARVRSLITPAAAGAASG